MNKNGLWIVIGVVVVVIAAAGGYTLYHQHHMLAKSEGASEYGSSGSNDKGSKSTAEVNNAVLMTKTDSSLGNYLTYPQGHPLYTFEKDASGVSNCTGSCLANWPAYQNTGTTAGLPTDVSTITRTDNSQMQFTYKGMPLYTFAHDTGSTPTGNDVNGFYIAKP